MVTRRHLLRGVLGFPSLRLAGASIIFSLFNQPARASIQAAIAVANFAITLFDMFTPKGPGIEQLVNLQTQMLLNLNAQMAVMERMLALVLQDIEELKQIVRDLPVETVREQYSTKLAAQLGNFRELMSTYLRVRETGDEAAARRELQDLPGILAPIKECRQALSLSTMQNEGVIPMMASAMQVEIISMILLGSDRYSDEAIRTVLIAYRNWFGQWLDPKFLRNLPRQCRSIADQMVEEKHNADLLYRGLLGRKCFRNVIYTDLDPSGGDFQSVSYDEVSFDFNENKQSEFADWLKTLEAKGLKFPEPLSRVVTRSLVLGTEHVDRQAAGDGQRHMNEVARRQGDSARCQNVPDLPEAAKEQFDKYNQTFDLQSSQLLAMYSFLLIASRARAACDAFYTKISRRIH